MKQPCDKEEDTVSKALYELIKILNEIDLDNKTTDKGSPDEMLIERGEKRMRVKL